MIHKVLGRVVGVIPARYNSTRFPGKVLVPIDGIPIVARVYYQACKAKLMNFVCVATDNELVYNEMTFLNIPVVMTSSGHRSGTERIAEVAKSADGGVFVNIQGDEPFIDPHIIDLAVEPFIADNLLKMGSVASAALTADEWVDPNVVKVRVSEDGFAEDFFRESANKHPAKNDYKHVGIYIFERNFLLEFAGMNPTANERERDLEQMRALDNGVPIKMVITDYDSIGINTPDDLKLAEVHFADTAN